MQRRQHVLLQARAHLAFATLLVAALLAACSQSQPPAPGFTLDAAGTTLTVAPGSSSSLALQVTPQNGFSGTVDLSLRDTQGQPATGLSVSPTSLNVGASGTTLAGVTVTADPGLATGVETFSLRVTGSGASASVAVLATIEPAPPPDFAVAASPTDVHADLGGSAATTVVVAPQSGFVGTVALKLLTASGAAAAGFTVDPSTAAVAAGQVATQAVAIGVDSSVPAGSYPLTLRATSGSLAHDVPFMVDVGNGAYAVHTDYAVAAVPAQVAAADVNGDGHLDLVTADYSQSSISVLIGNGDGTFRPHVDYASGTGPRALAVTDLDGNGTLDVVTLNENPTTTTNGTISVFLNAGDGTYPTHTNVAVPASPWDIAASDLNNDGSPDIVLTAGGGASAGIVALLLNNGDGTFGAVQTVALAPNSPSYPDGVATADLNGDGNRDVVVTDSVSNDAYVLLGKGDGSFQAPTRYTSGYQGTRALAIADLNGDGFPDIAALNTGLSAHANVAVLLGHGDGTVAAPLVTETANYPSDYTHAIALADVNGDGKLDAVVANEQFNTFSVLPGNGDGTFAAHAEYAAPGSPAELIVADVNHDGHPDVVTANDQAATVSVFLWR